MPKIGKLKLMASRAISILVLGTVLLYAHGVPEIGGIGVAIHVACCPDGTKLGRVVDSTQTTNAVPYLFRYQYNAGGGLTALQYPSATNASPVQPLKVSYNFSQAGRIIGVRKGETASTDTYLSAANYWANGVPAALQLGNSVIEETTINSLQQVTGISAKRDTTTLWRSDLTYSPTANNGNILTQTTAGTQVASPISYTQTYDYDALNRLNSVLDSGVGVAVDTKSQVFVYDRYGNRALKQNSFKQGGAVEVPQPTAAAVEAVFPGNRLNNCCNAAGDMTLFNGQTIVYDGEHRVMSVAYTDVSSVNILLEYFYDGDGRRVRATKKSNGTLTSSTVFVYDASGQLMAEYTTPNPVGIGRQYLTQDHLGSTRLVTKSSGTATDIIFSRHDFMPFGEELARGANAYGPSALSLKFTGQEREQESGLDYFGARYMAAAQGRFTSADAPFADQSPSDPQSWNLYSYVRNNPLRYVDPTGRDCVNLDNGTQGDDGKGTACAGAQLGTKHGVTVGVGRDEANLIMLQGLGELLSSPHQWATVVSGAGQGAMAIIAPLPTAIVQCIIGNCDKTNVAMAMLPMGAGRITRWGWAGTHKFKAAFRQLARPGTHEALEGIVPTLEEAKELIRQAGGTIDRIEKGHAIGGVSQHTYPHINYTTPSGSKATVRVESVK